MQSLLGLHPNDNSQFPQLHRTRNLPFPARLLRGPHHAVLHDDRWHVVSTTRAALPSRMLLLLQRRWCNGKLSYHINLPRADRTRSEA